MVVTTKVEVNSRGALDAFLNPSVAVCEQAVDILLEHYADRSVSAEELETWIVEPLCVFLLQAIHYANSDKLKEILQDVVEWNTTFEHVLFEMMRLGGDIDVDYFILDSARVTKTTLVLYRKWGE